MNTHKHEAAAYLWLEVFTASELKSAPTQPFRMNNLANKIISQIFKIHCIQLDIFRDYLQPILRSLVMNATSLHHTSVSEDELQSSFEGACRGLLDIIVTKLGGLLPNSIKVFAKMLLKHCVDGGTVSGTADATPTAESISPAISKNRRRVNIGVKEYLLGISTMVSLRLINPAIVSPTSYGMDLHRETDSPRIEGPTLQLLLEDSLHFVYRQMRVTVDESNLLDSTDEAQVGWKVIKESCRVGVEVVTDIEKALVKEYKPLVSNESNASMQASDRQILVRVAKAIQHVANVCVDNHVSSRDLVDAAVSKGLTQGQRDDIFMKRLAEEYQERLKNFFTSLADG
jgi:hypothetical protein